MVHCKWLHKQVLKHRKPSCSLEVPLHDIKVGVWCAISAQRIIIMTMFFHETINSELYMRFILSPFSQSTDWWKLYAHFMQNNATAHNANNFMVALDNVFGEQVISQGLWPPWSPDLNLCDFYLWGTLKKVYVNNLHSLEELEANIRHEISAIPVHQLRCVSRNIFSLREAYLVRSRGLPIWDSYIK
jgi:hypothetical protein